MRKQILQALTALCVLAIASIAPAETYLIDFNEANDAGGFPGEASAWNTYATPANIDGSVIADTTGSTTAGVTLGYTGSLADTSRTQSEVFTNPTGGPSWVTTDGSLANYGAAADYFYSLSNATLLIGGLTPGSTVNMDVWLSRSGSPVPLSYFSYSTDGGSTWSAFTVLNKDGSVCTADGWDTNDTLSQAYNGYTDANANARYMNASINITGTTLQVFSERAQNFTAFGAIRMDVVPEPATMGLLGAGALALIRRRRGK